MSIPRVYGGAAPVVTTGRALNMFTVSLANVHVDYEEVDSDFEKLVRAIETVGTVEILGTPSSGAFRVAISGSSQTSLELEAICNAAVATTTVSSYTF
jgi:hypothetical protein